MLSINRGSEMTLDSFTRAPPPGVTLDPMCLRLYHPRHRTQAPSTSPPVGSLPVEFCKPPCHTLSHPGSEEPTRANSKEPPFPRLRGASTHHRGPTFFHHLKNHALHIHTPAWRSIHGDHALATPQLRGASKGTIAYIFKPPLRGRRPCLHPSSEELPRGPCPIRFFPPQLRGASKGISPTPARRSIHEAYVHFLLHLIATASRVKDHVHDAIHLDILLYQTKNDPTNLFTCTAGFSGLLLPSFHARFPPESLPVVGFSAYPG